MSRVKVGQSASLKIDAYPQKHLIQKSPILPLPCPGADLPGYKIDFKLPVDNEDMRYRLGMDGDTTIKLMKKSTL